MAVLIPWQRFALYRMHNNTYLGDCMVIVCRVGAKAMAANGLTSPIFCLYIKTARDQAQFASLAEIASQSVFDTSLPILLRVASSCEFGIFGDSHCDCEGQRVACFEAIKAAGQGIFVQLPQEGMGHGLLYKARELELQVNGTLPNGEYIGHKDIYEAGAILDDGEIDKRRFAMLRQIFKKLGFAKYQFTLISANPQKIATLSQQMGLAIIGNINVSGAINVENAGVYLAKIFKNDIAFSDAELQQVFKVLASANAIPERTRRLIVHIGRELKAGRQFATNKTILQKIARLVTN